MATLEIETFDNEYALYDFLLRVNGETVASDENYTTQEFAEMAAYDAYRKWRTR